MFAAPDPSQRWQLGRSFRRHPVSTVFIAVSLLCLALLQASLSKGRTTVSTASIEWLLFFSLVLAVGATSMVVLWFALGRLSRAEPNRLANEMAIVSASSLPISVPALSAVYVSDGAFHYLATHPIATTVVAWAPVAVAAISYCALLALRVALPSCLEAWLRTEVAAPVLVGTAFTTLFVFSAGGHLYSPDEKEMFQVTENLVTGVFFGARLSPSEMPDQIYSKYGLVPSLFATVPYWISRQFGLNPEPPSAAFPIPNGAYPLVDLVVGPLFSAATCAVIYALARAVGFGRPSSMAAAVAYGLGTSAWVYSKTFLSQPVATFFVLSCVWLLMRQGWRPAPRYGLAGLMLGLAVGTRMEIALLATPILALVAWRAWSRRDGAVEGLVAFSMLFLLSAGLTVGWYNFAKTGSLLATGHGPQGTLAGFSPKPHIGLFGILFSSGFGFFVYNPLAMAGLVSLPLLSVVNRVASYILLATVMVAVVLYGTFSDWSGGFAWASRYLVVVLPLAVLPAAMLLEPRWRTPVSVALFAGAFATGLAVNALGVLFDWNLGWLDLWDHRATLWQIQWDPHFSPIGAHLRLLRSFLETGAKLDLYIYYRLGVPALVGFLLVFISFLSLAVRSALSGSK